jgi:eukaryotic-like serine/threonine-protein kinase
MSLTAGTKLGPYEILAPLGAGGMGEVYRAKDTRLGRDVAIKILPTEMSADAVRKQRFEREAKTISNLNHPHICVLHDVGHQNGIDYLVMECVEGETLAKRLEKGPLALEQVLKYGAQIADGLDKAHRSSVVHRDLKPGNIMLTPTGVKLLDFGLAKPAAPVASLATLSAVATQSPVTQEGTIVGTFQYMSPEQIEGKEVDGRSDIFSLGAVLYEMLTGKRAFEGKSQLSVASAILETEPVPISATKPLTPPALDHAIKKCLAKIPDERWQSAADVKHEIDWILQASAEVSTGSAAQSKKKARTGALGFVLGAIVLVTVGEATNLFDLRHKTAGPTIRATLTLPPNVTLETMGDLAGSPQISRDGQNLVFVGLLEGKQMLFVRPLNSISARPLTGTERGKFPFWSSDGKSVGFFADGQLKRAELAGGPPIVVASAPDGRGGTWAGDTILFAPDIYDLIYRVPASGGKPAAVTKLDRSQHTTHRWPHFLPDGKHFLYLAANHVNGKEENSAIFGASIEGGEPIFIFRNNGSVVFASGHLAYFRDGTLMAQEFEPGRMELRGDPMPLGDVLRETGNWGVMATASENGVLIYQSGEYQKNPIRWFDPSTRKVGPALGSVALDDLRLSPDGNRAAVVQSEGPLGSLYVWNLKTGTRTRLTFGQAVNSVIWSPDGKRVAYSATKPGMRKAELYTKLADGSGEAQLLLSSGFSDDPTDWTSDGRYIIFSRGEIGAQRVWVLPTFGDRKPSPLYPNADYDHNSARVSPNGRWIGYVSRETGPLQLLVTSFPSGTSKWQVTSVNTSEFRWRADGKELYFLAQDGNMMAASIEDSGGAFTVTGVRTMFRAPFANERLRTIFDVEGNPGGRFIGEVAPEGNSLPLNLVTNWTAELNKK